MLARCDHSTRDHGGADSLGSDQVSSKWVEASVRLTVYGMRGQNSDDSWVNSLDMVSSAVPTAPGNVSMVTATGVWS